MSPLYTANDGAAVAPLAAAAAASTADGGAAVATVDSVHAAITSARAVVHAVRARRIERGVARSLEDIVPHLRHIRTCHARVRDDSIFRALVMDVHFALGVDLGVCETTAAAAAPAIASSTAAAGPPASTSSTTTTTMSRATSRCSSSISNMSADNINASPATGSERNIAAMYAIRATTPHSINNNSMGGSAAAAARRQALPYRIHDLESTVSALARIHQHDAGLAPLHALCLRVSELLLLALQLEVLQNLKADREAKQRRENPQLFSPMDAPPLANRSPLPTPRVPSARAIVFNGMDA